MDLNDDADIDTSQVEDVRGSGGGGGGFLGGGGGGFGGGLGGIPLPIGRGRGGCLMTVVVLVIMLAAGGYFGRGALTGGSSQPANGNLASKCAASNPDRLKELDCRNVLYVNSIQAYWTTAYPRASGGKPYQKAPTVFFSSSVNTGCGSADSGVGPFYCPADKKVYIDLTFYQELTNRFGARGEFAQPYVLAHEYGHHVQDLLGTEAAARRRMQSDQAHANQYSVMLELQADCYAGVWARHATETTAANGKPIFNSITEQDIADAVQTAGTIGDDAIQKKMGSGVDESKFTHGSAKQRQYWLSQGYSSGEPASCDTFSAGPNAGA
jgi:predicted metalloprotease